tara:strand:- start:2141 stop:2323 length:183 start_codon:yes stop_codon:yes gene_type:complete
MIQYQNPDDKKIIEIEEDIGNFIMVRYIDPDYQTKLKVAKKDINSFIQRIENSGWIQCMK